MSDSKYLFMEDIAFVTCNIRYFIMILDKISLWVG